MSIESYWGREPRQRASNRTPATSNSEINTFDLLLNDDLRSLFSMINSIFLSLERYKNCMSQTFDPFSIYKISLHLEYPTSKLMSKNQNLRRS